MQSVDAKAVARGLALWRVGQGVEAIVGRDENQGVRCLGREGMLAHFSSRSGRETSFGLGIVLGLVSDRRWIDRSVEFCR